ncbi:MAG: PKD domain-containing protein, partial [Candidatus Nanohalobium sp.]
GGLVGNNTGSVSSSYWDNESSGQSLSDGGTGLTTSEMQGSAAETNMSGLDFSNNWTTVLASDPDTTGDGYPILQGLDRRIQLKAQGIYLSPDFSYSPSGPTTGESIDFDASSSEGSGSLSYSWDFGDGNNGNGATVSHTYYSKGDYDVKLTVTDSKGNAGSVTKTVHVSRPNDNNAPSISVDKRPSGTILGRTPEISGSTDERALLSYSVDGGTYHNVEKWGQNFDFRTGRLDNGQHTLTLRATDFARNSRTRDLDFTVADGSEVTFDVDVPQSYPNSAIPINPDSNIYPTSTDVDFDFNLQGQGHTYDISNDFQDGICSFHTDDGWAVLHDDGTETAWCGTEVPKDIELGTYNLVADWNLRGEHHRRVLKDSFDISEPGNWYSADMSHGGRIATGNTFDTNQGFEGGTDVVTRGDTKYTCTGSTYKIDKITTIRARCSDGAKTGSHPPPVVAWVYKDGSKYSTSNNDMFGNNNCKIEAGITRRVLWGKTDNHQDQGYLPDNCNLNWHLSGDSSFTVQTFTEPGSYRIYTDFVHAASNSPDYICPERTDNNNLCDTGSIDGHGSGWGHLKTRKVNIVKTEGKATASHFVGNTVEKTVNGKKYIRRKGYSGDIENHITFKNTGSGDISVDDLKLDCPSGVTCNVISKPGTVAEGDTAEIIWSASWDGRTKGTINVNLDFNDDYGLTCGSAAGRTITWKYHIDEQKPSTDQEVNQK